MAVRLPITDPILASLASLPPQDVSSSDTADTGFYGLGFSASSATDQPITYRSNRATRRFWLEFDVLGAEVPLRQPPGALTEFSFFPQLPAEIRMQIWEAAADHPRIIRITCRQAESRFVMGVPGNCMYFPPRSHTRSPALIPALFRVCRESYNVARQRYERAFDWRVPYDLADPPPQPRWRPPGHVPDPAELERDRLAELAPDAPGGRPSGPGCLFNFRADAVLLRGEMEPSDAAVSTSMVYFMRIKDTRRVRHVGCWGPDLGASKLQAAHLFARLFPIVDRFGITDELMVVVPSARSKAKAAAAVATRRANLTRAFNQGTLYPQVCYVGAPPLPISAPPTVTATASESEPRPPPPSPPQADASKEESTEKDVVRVHEACQYVWHQWTNSQNMPHMVDLHANNALEDDVLGTLYYSPEKNYKDLDNEIRILGVPRSCLVDHVVKHYYGR